MPPDGDVQTAVRQAFSTQLTAMTDRDTATLDALLADDFTLTHLSGYRQPKQEWLEEIAAGAFTYHHLGVATIEVDEDLGADQPSDAEPSHTLQPVLIGRLQADATVYGQRSRWRLQLTQAYSRTPDGWTATCSTATLW